MKVSAIVITLLTAVATALPAAIPEVEADTELLAKRGMNAAQCKVACRGGAVAARRICIAVIVFPANIYCRAVAAGASTKAGQNICVKFCDTVF